MNVFSGLAMYICLCLLLILPPVECDDKFEINETVYIEKGATSVDVSCGEVPQSAVAIEWSIYKSNEWRKLIKFYHTKPGTRHYFNESTKYDISEFVNTSLVVKNIKLSDSALFKCGSTGKSIHERYILLQVVVPPKSDYRPEFKRGDVKTSTSDDLKGPYMEHVNWNFTCCIRNVLPGKGSTLFEFYYNGNLRLQSKDNVGQVEESSEHDHTKQVKWIFTSSFNRSDNAGKMKCHVNWKAGRHKSGLESIPTDNVEVRFGATTLAISQVPTSAIKEGTTVTFKCASDEGNPPPLIHWNQGSGNTKVKPGRFNASITESTMSITVDRSWNQKEIGCFIRANQNRSQKSLKKKLALSVQFNATTIELTEKPEASIEGRVVQYVCETDSSCPYSPSVLWFVDDTPVLANDEYTVVDNRSHGNYHGTKTGSTLRFRTKRAMNMKKVKCMLQNDNKKFREHILNVKFKPSGLDMEIGEAVEENTEQSVVCKANSANPTSSVGMELFIEENNQRQIKPELTQLHGSDNGMIKAFVFRFTTNRSQNEKIIKCRLLWDGTFIKIKEDYLNITYPPEVSVDNTATPAVEYTTRNLTCRIRGGNPSDPMSYHYAWMYKPTYHISATDIHPPYGSSLLNGGDTLQLNNIAYDEMAGTYKCTVSGVGGQSSGNITLEVYYAAKLESTLEDMTVYAALGSIANLTVKFHINPIKNCNISWSMKYTDIQDADITSIEKGKYIQTTYSISEVTKLHLGKYTVQVINQAIMGEPNEALFTGVLKLRGPPEKPIDITILAKTHNSITVGWTAGLNGGSEQHFKVLYKEKGQENWKESQDSISGLNTGKSINYSITGLDAEKEYKITVMAINQFQDRSESLADVQTVFTEAASVLNSDLITGIVLPLVMFLVIAVGVIVAMFMRIKRRFQDDSKRTAKVKNDYQDVPRDSDLDLVKDSKPLDHAAPPSPDESPPDGEEYLGQTYEKLGNRPMVEDIQQVVYMKISDAQKQDYETICIKASGNITQPHPGGDNLPGRNYENLELLNRPVAEDKKQVPVPHGPTLVYADLTFQHIRTARQEAVTDLEQKVTYASVGLGLTKAYTLEDKE